MPPFADHVIVLQGGSVIAMGSYEDVISHVPEIAKRHPSDNLEAMELIGDGGETIEGVPPITESAPKQSAPANPADFREEDLPRRDGTWSTYQYYISRAGRWKPAFFLFCCLASAFFSNFVSKSNISPIDK